MTERPVAENTDEFGPVPGLIKQRLDARVGAGPMYTTDADGLFEVFLAALPPERRQHYTCSACRRFVSRYGGLAAIDEHGHHESALWNGHEPTLDATLAPAIQAMADAVRRATVTGVFVTSAAVLGTPQAGGWRHFAVEVSQVHHGVQTAGQVMASKREDFRMLERSLAEFPLELVRQALALLSSGNLYRSEKCLGVAKWLLELHQARQVANDQHRANLTWVAVASAPAGFCHVRSGMIGTLLEDIQAELPFATIKARFDAKMDPTQYMRPSAPPSAGNIAQAEKLVAELDSAGALARRFAQIDEIDALWRPAPPKQEPEPAGVFGHLLPTAAPKPGQPDVTMTWDKLSRTVLPDAARIEYYVTTELAFYAAIVTAVNPDAPPILQWDRPDRRNPASWYVYTKGSPPGHWNLEGGRWHPVTAVTYRPSMWYGTALPNQGRAVVFVLEGCRDTTHKSGGGFFPESLRSEYHGIRRTMEAYAQAATIAGRDEASACGISLQEGVKWDCRFRVTSKAGLVATYRLDRWD
jgi:hypothetical protein